MTPEPTSDDHCDRRRGDEQPKPAASQTGTPPVCVTADPTDPFYERLSLKPALDAIVPHAIRRIESL